MTRKDLAAAIKSCNDRIRELERMKIEALALAAYTMEEEENG